MRHVLGLRDHRRHIVWYGMVVSLFSSKLKRAMGIQPGPDSDPGALVVMSPREIPSHSLAIPRRMPVDEMTRRDV